MGEEADWAVLRRHGEQLARALLELAGADPDFVREFDREGGMTYAEVLQAIARMNGYASRKIHGLGPG